MEIEDKDKDGLPVDLSSNPLFTVQVSPISISYTFSLINVCTPVQSPYPHSLSLDEFLNVVPLQQWWGYGLSVVPFVMDFGSLLLVSVCTSSVGYGFKQNRLCPSQPILHLSHHLFIFTKNWINRQREKREWSRRITDLVGILSTVIPDGFTPLDTFSRVLPLVPSFLI